jgi:CheY-like chemotaxis protein
VLTNLLSNAIKFTSEGKVAVRVDAVEDGREHLRARFEVSDTGIGIEPESLEAIFDSFTQADGTTTRLYGGTGLGLAISRQLVDMMGGRLEVESVHGEGSTFSFTALMEVGRPLGLEDATGSEDLSEPRMGEQSSLTGRVLLAEDNPVNQAVAIGLLEGLGVSTVIATDGWDAVEKATSDEFDIVLMDCQMPVTDGYQATELIRRRERERGGRRLPIVAVTANALQGDREKCLASGMDAYLPKPFSAKDLHSVLRTFLDPAVAERPTEASSEAPADDGTDVEHELDYALDPSVLAALADCQGSGEPNFVKKTVDAYLSHSSRIVTDLGAAVDAMDSASILENAHALGSSSANVGATELARLCLGLEVMARDGDLAEAPGLRSEIDREYQRVAVALEAETSSVTAAI